MTDKQFEPLPPPPLTEATWMQNQKPRRGAGASFDLLVAGGRANLYHACVSR